MSGEPAITFIDRDGKATVVGPGIPLSGLPGITACDAAGKSLALRATVPQDAHPCAGISGPVAVSVESEEYLPGMYLVMPDDESRLDDWTCNAFSENFNSPPPASPPWTWSPGTSFVDGGVSGNQKSLVYNVASTWPYAMTAKFYWDVLLAGAKQSVFYLEARVGPWQWQRRYGAVSIDANFTANNYEFTIGALHENVGVTSSGPFVYDPGDPYDLDGDVLTVTIWDAGKITVNFHGQTHDNGGPT